MSYIKWSFLKRKLLFFFKECVITSSPMPHSHLWTFYGISHFFFTPIASSTSFLCFMSSAITSPVTPATIGIGVPGWLFAELKLGLGLLGRLTKGVGGRRLLGDAWEGKTSSIAESEKFTDLRLCPNRFVRLPNDERL